MSYIVKIHKTDDGRIFSVIIDKEIVGKKFDEGELQLDLTSPYYRGDETAEDETLKIISKSYSVSFIGEDSVRLGSSKGLVDEKTALRIKGIPVIHAMVFV